MYKHYIWDFDGTLFDTYPVILKGFVDALTTFGITAEPKDVYYILKSSSSKHLATNYQLDFEELTKVFKQFEEKDGRQPKPFEGTKEILEWVIAQHGTNYILTHRDQVGTKELLVTEQLSDLFTEIVGSESPFPRKPAPDSLMYLMDRYQMDPKETVMIGDRTMDVEAGRAAGIQTIFFDEDQVLNDVPATHLVNHLLKIKECE